MKPKSNNEFVVYTSRNVTISWKYLNNLLLLVMFTVWMVQVRWLPLYISLDLLENNKIEVKRTLSWKMDWLDRTHNLTREIAKSYTVRLLFMWKEWKQLCIVKVLIRDKNWLAGLLVNLLNRRKISMTFGEW